MKAQILGGRIGRRESYQIVIDGEVRGSQDFENTSGMDLNNLGVAIANRLYEENIFEYEFVDGARFHAYKEGVLELDDLDPKKKFYLEGAILATLIELIGSRTGSSERNCHCCIDRMRRVD